MVAATCLALQDIVVKKASIELGIPLSNTEGFKPTHKLIEDILDILKRSKARTPDINNKLKDIRFALNVTKSWTAYRNDVLHDGKPIPKQPQAIIEATNDLIDRLNELKVLLGTQEISVASEDASHHPLRHKSVFCAG
jgi:hypothetical protein